MDKDLIEKIREVLKKKELDVALFSDIYKILRIIEVDSSFNFIEVGFYLIITPEETILIGDPFSFSFVDIPEEIRKEVAKVSNLKKTGMCPIGKLKEVLDRMDIKKIGSFEKISLPDYEVEYIEDIIHKPFLFPDSKRIETLKDNAGICERILEDSIQKIHAGMHEINLRNIIDENLYKHGAERRAFPTKVLFGRNTSNPFSISNWEIIKEGSPLFINFGIIRKGIGMEVARTYILGTADTELSDKYKRAKNIYRHFIDFLEPGKITGEVYNYVWDLIEKNNLTENFIGPLSTPLSPSRAGIIISPGDSTILKPGILLSLQIGFYFPNNYGIRFHDLLILNERKLKLTDFQTMRGIHTTTD